MVTKMQDAGNHMDISQWMYMYYYAVGSHKMFDTTRTPLCMVLVRERQLLAWIE